MRLAYAFSLVILLAACGTSEEVHAETSRAGPPEVEHPYEEGVDAQAQIDAALALARADDKPVLLVFGANWCPWCRRLEHVFQNDARVHTALEDSFHLVHVDVGPRRSSTNRAVARRYGNPLEQGLPCLVVLENDGSVKLVQETGSLEEGDHHDPDLILAFFERARG